MNNKEMVFTEELMLKARECKSAEEIIALAKENGTEITEAQAEEYYKMLNPATGELADEELDNVSGGGCTVSVGGKKYKVVTSQYSCGSFLANQFGEDSNNSGGYIRTLWREWSDYGQCGQCYYLNFKSGTGYCSISA